MNELSIVIPVYHSEESLPLLVEKLGQSLSERYPDFQIYLVDDGSKDASWETIQAICEETPSIHGLRLVENRGQQNALLAGIQHTNSKFVVTIDDDLQHRCENIFLLMEKISEGYEAVYGIARDLKQRPNYRNWGAKLRNVFFTNAFGMPATVQVSSFRVISRELVDVLKKIDSGFVYLSAVILKYTKNIENVFYMYIPRPYGRSNYTLWKLSRLYLHILIQYSGWDILSLFKDKRLPYEICDVCNIDEVRNAVHGFSTNSILDNEEDA